VARRVSILEEIGRFRRTIRRAVPRGASGSRPRDFLEKLALRPQISTSASSFDAGVSANREFLAASRHVARERAMKSSPPAIAHHFGTAGDTWTRRPASSVLADGPQGVPTCGLRRGEGIILSLASAPFRTLSPRVRVTCSCRGPSIHRCSTSSFDAATCRCARFDGALCGRGLAALASGTATRVAGRMNRS